VLTILVDENLDGYAAPLSQLLYSPEWSDLSSALDIRVVTFDQVGLAKGVSDAEVWESCQQRRYYLITDNRNEDKADSLGTTIRSRTVPTSLPVFTISDVGRFRSEGAYRESLVATLLEYALDAPNLLGTGRLYLP
jgi:hypothetical protein